MTGLNTTTHNDILDLEVLKGLGWSLQSLPLSHQITDVSPVSPPLGVQVDIRSKQINQYKTNDPVQFVQRCGQYTDE